MTADGETGTRRRSHQHTIYCSAADRVLIGKRAQEAGMNFSRFMIACALHGGDEDDGEEGPRLVLSEDEQRKPLWAGGAPGPVQRGAACAASGDGDVGARRARLPCKGGGRRCR